MAAKRNKPAEDAAAQAAAEEAKNAEANIEPQIDPAEDQPQVEPINADQMAADVKVGGNSYQQYARQMFKDRLEESR